MKVSIDYSKKNQQILQIKQPNTWFDHVTPEQHISAFSTLVSISAVISRTSSFVCAFQNCHTSLLNNNDVLWCDNAVVQVLLGLGKDHGLS